MAEIDSQLKRAQLENLTTAQEPGQGTTGRTWLNTDTGFVRVDDGTTIKDVGTAAVPAGAVMDWSGGSAPAGWLLADGSAQLRASFPALNSLYSGLGYPYGNGDGATTFNMPDLRGRVSVGRDDMGGGPANRVTAAESGITGTNLGASGGAETHALSQAELASHVHNGSVSGTTSTNGSHTHTQTVTNNAVPAGVYDLGTSGNSGSQNSSNSTASAGNHNHTFNDSFVTTSVGSGDTHQNMQPSLILNKIVKT